MSGREERRRPYQLNPVILRVSFSPVLQRSPGDTAVTLAAPSLRRSRLRVQRVKASQPGVPCVSTGDQVEVCGEGWLCGVLGFLVLGKQAEALSIRIDQISYVCIPEADLVCLNTLSMPRIA